MRARKLKLIFYDLWQEFKANTSVAKNCDEEKLEIILCFFLLIINFNIFFNLSYSLLNFSMLPFIFIHLHSQKNQISADNFIKNLLLNWNPLKMLILVQVSVILTAFCLVYNFSNLNLKCKYHKIITNRNVFIRLVSIWTASNWVC